MVRKQIGRRTKAPAGSAAHDADPHSAGADAMSPSGRPEALRPGRRAVLASSITPLLAPRTGFAQALLKDDGDWKGDPTSLVDDGAWG